MAQLRYIGVIPAEAFLASFSIVIPILATGITHSFFYYLGEGPIIDFIHPRRRKRRIIQKYVEEAYKMIPAWVPEALLVECGS